MCIFVPWPTAEHINWLKLFVWTCVNVLPCSIWFITTHSHISRWSCNHKEIYLYNKCKPSSDFRDKQLLVFAWLIWLSMIKNQYGVNGLHFITYNKIRQSKNSKAICLVWFSVCHYCPCKTKNSDNAAAHEKENRLYCSLLKYMDKTKTFPCVLLVGLHF